MDNSLVVGLLGGIVIGVIVVIASISLAIYSRNKNRYDIPKYLPRDDERIWAMVTACSKRMWSLRKCKYIRYIDWDLGVIESEHLYENYDTDLRIGDVILAPKKWGGMHACVVIKALEFSRYITAYLGEFNGQANAIFDGRDRTGAKVIQ